MSLADIVNSAVATAKTVTESLQATVTLEACTGDDEYGNRTYGTAASYKVILTNRVRYVTGRDKEAQLSKAQIQFIEAVQVKEEDRITLPDGTKPQILAVDGVADSSGNYYAPQVYF